MDMARNNETRRRGVCEKTIVCLLLFLGIAAAGYPYTRTGGSRVGQPNFAPSPYGRQGQQLGYGNYGHGLPANRYGAPSVSNPSQGFSRLGNFPSHATSFRRPNSALTYGKQNPYGANPYPSAPYGNQHSSGKNHPNPYQGGNKNAQSNYYQKKAPNGYSNGGYKSQSSFHFVKQPTTCNGCTKGGLNPGKSFASFPSPFTKGGLLGGGNSVFNLLSSFPSKAGTGSKISLRRNPAVQSQHISQDSSYAQRQAVPHNGRAKFTGFPSASGYKNPGFPNPGGYQQHHPGQAYSSYQNPYLRQNTFKLNSHPSPQPYHNQPRPGQYSGSFAKSAGYFPPPKSSQTYSSSNSQYPGGPQAYRNAHVTRAAGGQRRMNAQNTNNKFADGDNYHNGNAYSTSNGDATGGRGGYDTKNRYTNSFSDQDSYSDRKKGGTRDGYNNHYDNSVRYHNNKPTAASRFPAAYGPAAYGNRKYQPALLG